MAGASDFPGYSDRSAISPLSWSPLSSGEWDGEAASFSASEVILYIYIYISLMKFNNNKFYGAVTSNHCAQFENHVESMQVAAKLVTKYRFKDQNTSKENG